MKRFQVIQVVFIVILLFSEGCQNQSAIHHIGDVHGGGTVFYVDATGEHGLIAAPMDQDSAEWWNGSIIQMPTRDNEEIGTGQTNTAAIVSAQGSGNYAAMICSQLVLNGYDDWFLPSYAELGLICENLYHQNQGNFLHQKYTTYWSSSGGQENGDAMACCFEQRDGSCGGGKNPSLYKFKVRAVRAF